MQKKPFCVSRPASKFCIGLVKGADINTKTLYSLLTHSRNLYVFDKCQHVYQMRTRS